MLQQYFGSRKSKLFAFAGLILFALLLLGLRIVSLQKAASEVVFEPALKLSYCGAEPEELCVLSFGRDAEEKMVVNLFVPDRKLPEFYLKIKRLTGESVYKCEKNKEVPTSVFCFGEMVNLQEKMDIGLFSKNDDHLMAAGAFILKALLISEPALAGEAEGAPADDTSASSEIFDSPVATPTRTPSPTPTPTPSLTQTPDASYPNSSYP